MHTGRRDHFGDGVDGANTVAYLLKKKSVNFIPVGSILLRMYNNI
jgi:hypothetical protein